MCKVCSLGPKVGCGTTAQHPQNAILEMKQKWHAGVSMLANVIGQH